MRCAWLGVLLIGGICLGCDSGPKAMPIEGEVTFDGQPISKGTIQFIPAEGTLGRSTGGSITNGRYGISKKDGLLADGTYAVRIRGLRKTGKRIPHPENPKGKPIEVQESYIPLAYNSQTILKVDHVESTLDFHLEKNPVP